MVRSLTLRLNQIKENKQQKNKTKKKKKQTNKKKKKNKTKKQTNKQKTTTTKKKKKKKHQEAARFCLPSEKHSILFVNTGIHLFSFKINSFQDFLDLYLTKR